MNQSKSNKLPRSKLTRYPAKAGKFDSLSPSPPAGESASRNNTRTKILDELMLFFEHIMVPYLDNRFGGVEGRLGGVENRLDKVETGIQELKTEVMYVRGDVRDLKADSPTAKEFTDHEKRITSLEKTAFSA